MNAKSFDSTIYTNITIIEVSMMKDLCAIKITEESLPFIYKTSKLKQSILSQNTEKKAKTKEDLGYVFVEVTYLFKLNDVWML